MVRSLVVRGSVVVSRSLRIWSVIATLVAATAGLWLLVASLPWPSHHRGSLGVWLGIALVFFATESYVVHLNVGRHAH
jgi:hypothetical protein